MNGLLQELAQPQQVTIHANGSVSIPKKPDGSVWTLEELRDKMRWSRWPVFDELEPLFRRWLQLRYKSRFHRYWTVDELVEMKEIQEFLGLENS